MREAYLTSENYEAVELTKVKLTRKAGVTIGLYVEYTLGEGGGHAELTAQHYRTPHPDLLACLDRLVPHLCFLAEAVPGVQDGELWHRRSSPDVRIWLSDGQLHEFPEFRDYTVTGYVYDEKGGVVLVGRKALSNRKVMNQIAPREDLAPDQLTGLEYEYLTLLAADLGACDAEVRLYLAGKTGPMVVQGELDFGADESDEEGGDEL